MIGKPYVHTNFALLPYLNEHSETSTAQFLPGAPGMIEGPSDGSFLVQDYYCSRGTFTQDLCSQVKGVEAPFGLWPASVKPLDWTMPAW